MNAYVCEDDPELLTLLSLPSAEIKSIHRKGCPHTYMRKYMEIFMLFVFF